MFYVKLGHTSCCSMLIIYYCRLYKSRRSYKKSFFLSQFGDKKYYPDKFNFAKKKGELLISPTMFLLLHHVKRPVSVRSRVCVCRRSLMTIHARSGSRRRIAVSSAKLVKMLQSVSTRWRSTKWFGNQKFPGFTLPTTKVAKPCLTSLMT